MVFVLSDGPALSQMKRAPCFLKHAMHRISKLCAKSHLQGVLLVAFSGPRFHK